MPQVDGYTASRKLADNPATRPVPIIILTAKGQMQDLFDSSPNVASYVEKPFDPKMLRETVKTILAKKK